MHGRDCQPVAERGGSRERRGVHDHVMREPFAEMHEAQASVDLNGRPIGKRRRPENAIDQTEADLLVAALSGGGSSKTAMVGEGGFEPPTTSTQSSCTTGLCDSPR